jgi:hypothetical protein
MPANAIKEKLLTKVMENEMQCPNGVTSWIYATPLGLVAGCDRLPRIAALPQSWAGGRNPVGIPGDCAFIVEKERAFVPNRIPLAWP